MFILTAGAALLALHVARFDPNELPGELSLCALETGESAADSHCSTGSFYNVLPALLFSPLAFLGALPIIVLRKQTITSELILLLPRFTTAKACPDEQLPSPQPRLDSLNLSRSATLPPFPSFSRTYSEQSHYPPLTSGARHTPPGRLSWAC